MLGQISQSKHTMDTEIGRLINPNLEKQGDGYSISPQNLEVRNFAESQGLKVLRAKELLDTVMLSNTGSTRDLSYIAYEVLMLASVYVMYDDLDIPDFFIEGTFPLHVEAISSFLACVTP